MVKLFSLNASLLGRWQNALETVQPVCISEPDYAELSPDDIVLLHLQSLTDDQRKAMLMHSRSARIIVLTDTPDFDEGRQFILSGIRGYVNTYIHETLMPDMLVEIEKGNIWAVPELIQSVLQNLLKQNVPDSDQYDLSGLSEREREVFDQLVKGLSNKDIASALNITERTVKAHVGGILRKTGAPDRVHLILHATSSNLG